MRILAGRRNINYCFNPTEFATRYPRGTRELRQRHLGTFRLRISYSCNRRKEAPTTADGRVFSQTNDSATIADALLAACRWSWSQLHSQLPGAQYPAAG